MLNSTTYKFDFDDVLIQPSVLTQIRTRSKIDCTYEKSTFPIFAAPMDTVIDEKNYKKFLDLGINVCLPRGINIESPNTKSPYLFTSVSLTEAENFKKTDQLPNCLLIDIANGHMEAMKDVIIKLKKQHPKTMIMVGNIANPETFKELSNAGADFIRVGIGNGAGCLTTQNAALGYPMASLVNEIYQLKIKENLQAKIVADGGFKDYADIIKGLALGADYIMLGSIFNKCIESAGTNYFKGIKIPECMALKLFKKNFEIIKYFRGMSTKEVQKKWGRKKLKTSEGVVRKRKAEYTLSGFVENLEHYLKSNMSYCNAINLAEYIGKADFNLITTNARNRFAK